MLTLLGIILVLFLVMVVIGLIVLASIPFHSSTQNNADPPPSAVQDNASPSIQHDPPVIQNDPSIQNDSTLPYQGDGFDQYTRAYIKSLIHRPFETVAQNQIMVQGHLIRFITTYHTDYPHNQLNPQAYNIVLDGEPMNLSKLQADLILTTKTDRHYLPPLVPCIYIPYYVTHLDHNGLDPYRLIKPQPAINKSKFCFFAYSNCNEQFIGVRARKAFYERFQQRIGGHIDNLGICYNNPDQVIKGNNFELICPYKFCIAFENDHIEGYITEKMVNPMLAQAIPIYLGAPDVASHFNTKSFIHVRDFSSFDDCIDHVLKVDRDPALYQQMLDQPWLIDNRLSEDFSLLTGGSVHQQIKAVLPDHLKFLIQ